VWHHQPRKSTKCAAKKVHCTEPIRQLTSCTSKKEKKGDVVHYREKVRPIFGIKPTGGENQKRDRPWHREGVYTIGEGLKTGPPRKRCQKRKGGKEPPLLEGKEVSRWGNLRRGGKGDDY